MIPNFYGPSQPPYITNGIQKGLMTRLKLRNEFLKIKSQDCKQAYNKKYLCCNGSRSKEKLL